MTLIKRTVATVLLAFMLTGCQTSKQTETQRWYPQGEIISPEPERVKLASHQDDNFDQLEEEVQSFGGPRTLDTELPETFWELGLDQVISVGLSNSDVLKDVGGRLLLSPDSIPTVFDTAIRDSDPLFGTSAALSEFDTQFATSLFWDKNDRAVNNIVLGGGAREIQQDLGVHRAELSRISARGTQFFLRNLTTYDASNQSGNLFPSAWDTQLELGLRHPFLQGGGLAFNQIAGPDAQPGFNFSSGILIARVNTEMSAAEFETAVRNFVSQLEDAYWDLYFAYRDLESKIAARDSALKTWRSVEAKFDRKLRGGEADKEAQARAQYYLFEEQVQDALSGSPNNGSSIGIYRGERRLRLMMGLPANDGDLIRPKDTPNETRIVFDWDVSLGEAFARRVELRRQKSKIKRRELELIAARSFTLPRLDGLALHRWRGFGDDLTGGGGRFASAVKDFGSGDHQEWRMGVELQVPIGYRQGRAAVRSAELQLSREKAILVEQELAVSHAVSDAIAELVRAHASVRVTTKRLEAARQRRDATDAALAGDKATLDLLLDAQQRLADAETGNFRALAQYAKAIKNVHREKGSLLEFNGVYLSENLRPVISSSDRWQEKQIDYRLNQDSIPQQAKKLKLVSGEFETENSVDRLESIRRKLLPDNKKM